MSLWFYVLACCIFASADATLTVDKVIVKVLEPTLGTCEVKINPGPPKSINYDVHALIDAKDVMVRKLFLKFDINFNLKYFPASFWCIFNG